MIKQLSKMCFDIKAEKQKSGKRFCKARQKATPEETNIAESEENSFAYENRWALTALDWKLQHDCVRTCASMCAFLGSLVHARK